MGHLIKDIALKYIGRQMEEGKIIEIDRHLSTCDACAERVRAMRMLADNFDAIWDSWTAKSHAKSNMQFRIAGALAQLAAEERSSEFKARFNAWRDKIQTKSEVALRVIRDASKKAARIISEGAEDMLKSGISLTPAFRPVTTRGAVRTRGAMIKRRPPKRATIEIVSFISVWTLILNEDLFVDPDEIECCVRIKIIGIEKMCQLAVLDPLSHHRNPIAGFFKQEDDCLLTELRGVRGGKYSVYLL